MTRRLGRDLLREHIEWRIVRNDAIEIAATGRAKERRTFDEIIERHRQHAPLGRAADGVPRPAHTLKQRRNAMRRPDLTDQVDVPDIDAELERCGGDERFQRAGLETMLGVEAPFLGETSMVSGDRVFTDPVAEMSRDALRHPPRIDEYQRRPVFSNQRGQAIVVLLPHLVGHDRIERRLRDLDGQVDLAPVALVDDCAAATIVAGADEKARDFVDRLLRRGQADALEPSRTALLLRAQRFETLQCQRQMRSTSRPDDRVNLVHDHRARRLQHLTAPLCRQEQVQRLWRRHQDVRWGAQHGCALGGGCIAGADGSRDAGDLEAGLFSQLAQCASRLGQILVDVSAQRLQRRHIHDADGVGQRRFETFPDEIVDRRQKCREGLARAGGRGDERVLTGTDRIPSAALCGRRLSERIEKPARNQRMEPGHHGGKDPAGISIRSYRICHCTAGSVTSLSSRDWPGSLANHSDRQLRSASRRSSCAYCRYSVSVRARMLLSRSSCV